jgi:hypothetical protein
MASDLKTPSPAVHAEAGLTAIVLDHSAKRREGIRNHIDE